MTNIEIIAKSGKFNKVEDIFNDFELVVDLLKQDVVKTLAKAGITITNIDDYYAAAVKKIKENLSNKKHLRGIKKLLSCKNVEQGLKILLSKLRGYTHNNMLQSRKNSVAFLQKRYKNEVEAMDTVHDPLELLIAEEEAKEQLERAKQGKRDEMEKFKKMIEDGEIKAGKTGCGNTQLRFQF